MNQTYLDILNIFLSALTPLGELRLAIPWGLTQSDLSPVAVYFIAVFGNIIPPVFILLLLPRATKFFNSKSKLIKKFLEWLFERTRRRTAGKIEKYGPLALILFVAIPLPNTGAWTGSIAAWLFGLPFKKSIIYIFYGILIAGIIVTAITLGAKKII